MEGEGSSRQDQSPFPPGKKPRLYQRLIAGLQATGDAPLNVCSKCTELVDDKLELESLLIDKKIQIENLEASSAQELAEKNTEIKKLKDLNARYKKYIEFQFSHINHLYKSHILKNNTVYQFVPSSHCLECIMEELEKGEESNTGDTENNEAGDTVDDSQ